MTIREAIGPTYAGLEEAKADVVGMFGLQWLVDRGALPKEKLEEYYASYVAGIFRTMRFGTGEAHGQAEMMEFNYLSEQGAFKRQASGKYAVDYGIMPAVLADLAKVLLEIEATGDRDARGELVYEIRCSTARFASHAEDRCKPSRGCGPALFVPGEGKVAARAYPTNSTRASRGMIPALCPISSSRRTASRPSGP